MIKKLRNFTNQASGMLVRLACTLKTYSANVSKLFKTSLYILGAITFIFFTLSFYETTFNDRIYIDKIVLPQNFVQVGLSSETILDLVIQENIKVNQSFKSNDLRFLRHFQTINNLENIYCSNGIDLHSYISQITTNIVTDPAAKLDETQFVIPSTSISLYTFHKTIQAAFGHASTQLNSYIVQEKNLYKVIVIANFGNGIRHKSESYASSKDSAQKQLTLLIMKYSNPIVYAYLIYNQDISNAKEAILIARSNIKKYRDNSATLTFLGFLYLSNNRDSAKQSNALEAYELFENALKIDKADSDAVIGKILSKNIYSEHYPSTVAEEKIFIKESASILSDLISKNRSAKQAAYLRAELYSKHYPQIAKNYFHSIYLNAKKSDKSEAFLAYIIFLISIDEIAEADEFWRENVNNLKGEWQTIYSYKLIQLNEKNYNNLNTGSEFLGSCGSFLWAEELLIAARNENNTLLKGDLLENANYQINFVERLGAKNYKLYETWAIILSHLHRYEEANEKFSISTKYHGTAEWAYNNMSVNYLTLGKYAEAEFYAKKSLEITTINASIINLLYATYLKKDFKTYIKRFEYWYLDIPAEEMDEFSYFFAVSNCEIGNNDRALREISKLRVKYYNFPERNYIEKCNW